MGMLDFVNPIRPIEELNILGHNVKFSNDEVFFPKPQIEFDMNLNLVTISSVGPKDILAQDYEFKEDLNVMLTFAMHRAISFNLKPSSLKEALCTISKIYVEIFKNKMPEADICCSGFEFLYVKKLCVYTDNIVSIKLEYINNSIGK